MSILIVDDSQLTRTHLLGLLSQAGYGDFLQAETGAQALGLLGLDPDRPPSPNPIDLVLLDLVLPDLDGLELLRRLKASPQGHEIPVILVTSHEDPQSLKGAFELGAVDFILKPVRETETLARVRAAFKLKREMDERRNREQELIEMTHKLEQVVQSLKAISVLDGLTGVYNRRQFDETLDKEWRRAQRDGSQLSLLMIDLDHFKPYNDTFGHLKGDECLRRVAQCLRAQLKRPGDMMARYGGEEFVMVLPSTHAPGAERLSEMMRASVEALGLPHAGTPWGRTVTISVGRATMVPARGHDASELIDLADQGLYKAKAGGRNRVECVQEAAS